MNEKLNEQNTTLFSSGPWANNASLYLPLSKHSYISLHLTASLKRSRFNCIDDFWPTCWNFCTLVGLAGAPVQACRRQWCQPGPCWRPVPRATGRTLALLCCWTFQVGGLAKARRILVEVFKTDSGHFSKMWDLYYVQGGFLSSGTLACLSVNKIIKKLVDRFFVPAFVGPYER